MLTDVVVENIGGLLNLWKTEKSMFKVGHAPIEVLATCIPVGSLWLRYAPHDVKQLIIYVLLTSLTGTYFEDVLCRTENIKYENWSSILAFALYMIVFSIYYGICSCLGIVPEVKW